MSAAPSPKIIVALDYANARDALVFIDQVSPELCRLKIGKELFTAAGPDFVRRLVERNFSIFLDLKFHDIPNQVSKACVAAAELGVWMITVHCLGGKKMMEAAAKALKDGNYSTRIVGVTLLTSMDETTSQEVGLSRDIEGQVLKLGMLAKESGLNGVVCSPNEVAVLRKKCGENFLLVTPGIRDNTMPPDDQYRTMTPEEALAAGSDYLVIGRMITADPTPVEKLKIINKNLR